MNKQQTIVTMFDTISKRYDITNRILSFGIDKTWRRKACELAYNHYNSPHIDHIIDIACGTGDMIGHWRDTALKKNTLTAYKSIVSRCLEMYHNEGCHISCVITFS